MKLNLKSMAIGVVIGATLVSGVVMATPVGRNLWAEFPGIRILIDGVRLEPTDVHGNYVEPFIVDGTTYVPIRAIAQAFGKEVNWDGDMRRVIIGEAQHASISVFEAFIEAFNNGDESKMMQLSTAEMAASISENDYVNSLVGLRYARLARGSHVFVEYDENSVAVLVHWDERTQEEAERIGMPVWSFAHMVRENGVWKVAGIGASAP